MILACWWRCRFSGHLSSTIHICPAVLLFSSPARENGALSAWLLGSLWFIQYHGSHWLLVDEEKRNGALTRAPLSPARLSLSPHHWDLHLEKHPSSEKCNCQNLFVNGAIWWPDYKNNFGEVLQNRLEGAPEHEPFTCDHDNNLSVASPHCLLATLPCFNG